MLHTYSEMKHIFFRMRKNLNKKKKTKPKDKIFFAISSLSCRNNTMVLWLIQHCEHSWRGYLYNPTHHGNHEEWLKSICSIFGNLTGFCKSCASCEGGIARYARHCMPPVYLLFIAATVQFVKLTAACHCRFQLSSAGLQRFYQIHWSSKLSVTSHSFCKILFYDL